MKYGRHKYLGIALSLLLGLSFFASAPSQADIVDRIGGITPQFPPGDPNQDALLYWNDTLNRFAFLGVGSGLSISGGNLTSTGGLAAVTTNASLTGDGTVGTPLGLNLGNANTWTASQTFRASSTSAATAGLYLQSGALMTAPEVGAVEFLTDKPYFTITTGAARKEFTLNDAALTATRIPFATTNGRLTDLAGLTVTAGPILTTQSLTVSALTSGRVPFLGGGGSFTDSSSLTYSAPTLAIGTASSAAGILKFNQSSGIQTASITTPTTGSSYTITLPSSVSSQGVYVNSAGGQMSVQTALTFSTGGTNATSYGANRVIFVNSGNTAFTSDSGFTFSTPKLTLPAATTSGASLLLTAGTAPSSPVSGDLWTDSTQKAAIAFQAGIKEAIVGAIFTQTADQTVTNTVTETTILGTGVGTKTLPANFFVAGKTVRIRVGGIYSTPIGVPAATIKVKYGSTVIATVTTTALLASATSLEFDGDVLITCRSTGASGTVMTHGDIKYATGTAGQLAVDPLNNAGATTTIDTTASSALDVTLTWDSASSTRIAKSIVSTIEVLN